MKKKIVLRLIIGLLAFASGFLVLTFGFRPSGNLESPKKGRAIFHQYDFEIVDSIIRNSSTEQLISKILIQPIYEDTFFAAGFSEPQTKYVPRYLAEKKCQKFPHPVKNHSRLDSVSLFLKAIGQNGSKAFAGDSVFIPNWQTLNSIASDSLLIDYNNYHTSFISKLGFNSKLIGFWLPDGPDKKQFGRVFERLRSEVSNLHRNRILSILDIRGKSLSNNSIVAKSQVDFFSNLARTGLCGVICDRIENLELLDSLGFDGLFIYEVKGQEGLSKKIFSISDAFLLSKGEEAPYVIPRIVKHRNTHLWRKKAFKIVRAVLWAHRHQEPTFVADYPTEDMLRSNITKNSLILLKNTDSLIPFSNLNQKFLVINTTGQSIFHFKDKFSRYCPHAIYLEHPPGTSKPLNIPVGTDQIIILLDQSQNRLNVAEIATLERHKSITFVKTGNDLSYALKTAKAVLKIHEITDQSLSYSAQLLFGGIPANGLLSYDLNDTLILGYGITTKKTRLEYTLPENAGLCSHKLKQITSIMDDALISKAFPGAQILVAKNGKVVFEKTFGHLDYTKSRLVQRNYLYDVASITKVAATTLAVMKLHEQGRLNILSETGRYFKNTKIDFINSEVDTPKFINTLNLERNSKNELIGLVKNKDSLRLVIKMTPSKETAISKATPENNIFKIPIRKLLIHQSGMSPELPILPYVNYGQTFDRYHSVQKPTNDTKEFLPVNLREENPKPKITQSKNSWTSSYPFNFFFSTRKVAGIADVWVAEYIYLRNQFRDSIYNQMKRLGVQPNPSLQYACMNMILAQMVVDSINQTNLDVYLKSNFFIPLGMHFSTFTPLKFLNKDQIAPTENDTLWRKTMVHGTVHDPSAALLGGVAGNAGLFSTASDLAILGQMWLNLGVYGGRKYLNPSTIKTFIEKQPENHRGLGFDKPVENGIHAHSLPKSAYGHTGFTGCAMWVDPEHEIVFIFLSNRIHPSASNQIINEKKIRQRIHQVVYDSFL